MTIEEMLEQVDIVDYISQYVDLEEKNGEYWGLSPFKDENTPSFSVRRETGKFYDFSSGIGGTLVCFIQHYNKISKYEAVLELKKYVGADDSVVGCVKKPPKLAATQVCLKFAPKKQHESVVNMRPLPQNYMDRYEIRDDKLKTWRDEGISDDTMRIFGVKYDAFSNCIVYPIKNEDGEIVNIGGRTLDPEFKAKGMRKYTYFRKWKDFGGLRVVYGLFENAQEIKKCHEVIVFEGVKSVFIAREYGFKNCAAILTSHLNPWQMRILAKLGVRVIFALDKEVDVRKDHNIAKLARYSNVSFIRDHSGLLAEKDSPVDRGKDVFVELINNHRVKY